MDWSAYRRKDAEEIWVRRTHCDAMVCTLLAYTNTFSTRTTCVYRFDFHCVCVYIICTSFCFCLVYICSLYGGHLSNVLLCESNVIIIWIVKSIFSRLVLVLVNPLRLLKRRLYADSPLLLLCPYVSFIFFSFLYLFSSLSSSLCNSKRTTSLTCNPNLGRCTGPRCPDGWRCAKKGNSTKKKGNNNKLVNLN